MSRKQALDAKSKGNKFFSQKNFEKAVEWYTKAISYDSNDETFYSNRAAAYMSLKKYDNALSDAEEAIRLKPRWIKGYYRKGLACQAVGRHTDAANAFAKGLEVDPGNADLKKKHADALKAAENEVPRFDADGNPHSSAMIAKLEGNQLFKKSNYPGAIEKYSRAIELAEDDALKAACYNNRAACYSQLQDVVNVNKDCTESINLVPSAKAYIRRGIAREALEKYKGALEDMKCALEMDPSATIASEKIARLTRTINQIY